jgi:beta-mannosidase
MLRVGGTMGYAPQAFHDLCDELGILVWQDFMFANMDYPIADAAFAAAARAEAIEVVDRLQLSPSLAIFCGGSEVAQQAAMLGLPEAEWSSPLFQELLPGVVRAGRPDVAYVASTPEGGALPFRVDEGVSHYYGVGAYLRPLEDARRARVRFTAECLAFSNVPCDETIESLLGDGESPPTHPRWKARVPRDRGASWDFEDVRDHYLRRLFDVDPTLLRTSDRARYLELGRVVTGEAMLAAVSEWRRAGSECRGALVWLLRDLWAGAGWGVVDALGRPKAAYHYLARAFANVALLATDEGLNGLSLHAVNDGPVPIDAEVKVTLYRGEARVAEGSAPLLVPAHGVVLASADALLGRFVDTTYAYRFGPPGHDLVVGTLMDRASGKPLGRAFHFPCGYPHARSGDLGIEAVAAPTAEGEAGAWRVTVRSKRLALAVAFDTRGYAPDDEFFHLEPGGERTVTLHGPRSASSPGRVVPLNAASPVKIAVPISG